MGKDMKKIASVAAAIVAVVSLTGCGKGFAGDMTPELAVQLVQGNLDEMYMGKFDQEYLELVDMTQEEAQAAYTAGLETEADIFAYYFSIQEPDDELKAQIVDLFKEIYSRARYTVGQAKEIGENTYDVQVTVEPIDLIQQMSGLVSDALAPLIEKYGDINDPSMSQRDRQEYQKQWGETIIDLAKETLPQMDYMDQKLVTIQVVKNQDGVWSLSQEGFDDFDDSVVYYP